MAAPLTDTPADWPNPRPNFGAYQSGQQSFVADLLPQTAVQFPVAQTLGLLHKRLGTELLRRALDPHETIDSPRLGDADASWLKRTNMVGINVRTLGSFWDIISYVLTLPASHDSIHLLPIWEPGVVGSLYGMVSWQLNPAFFSIELARYVPALSTVERQLKAVVNVLHVLERTVGMDVIPHTDRFSEMVLAYPSFFEWVRREGAQLIDHSESVHQQAEAAIWQFLHANGTADGSWLTSSQDEFFSPTSTTVSDEQRHRILFGHVGDYGGRLRRRLALIQHLTAQGLETLPMTMAPPYRGLHIDADAYVLDESGQRWYQYAFDEPQAFSRVFGPLARYKFYQAKDDNQNWALDFDRPNYQAWYYVGRKYNEIQQQYNFDFMRGDMAHVQLQPTGVPDEPGEYYDPLRFVKRYVQGQGVRHFGFFAETFLAPPDTMGYGDELAHLEAIEAESTLGDLQSCVVGSDVFIERFTHYYDWLKTRRFAPNFTVMTADKDDPRFDEFYRTGNLFRYFTALFLTDMPSYVGLGFEVRNRHGQRGLNEEYSKLYVFQIRDEAQPDKVTHGPFVWGQNGAQFAAIQRMRQFGERIWNAIAGKETVWISPPQANRNYVIWTHAVEPVFVFAVSWSETLPANLPGVPLGDVVFDEAGCRVYQVKNEYESQPDRRA